ncbi:MAG: hypothetical protein HN341_18470 [Verrucomicrobia bacterium]|jgi:hypothetical protein|nr:hypothetical protein [Verrucomicrobiota bacterium]
MNSPGPRALRDEVLRKIGRNLVNFQKMEKALKTIVSRSKMSGVVSEIELSQKKRDKAIEQRTMGSLVKDFMGSVHSDVPLNTEEPDDLTEAWVSVSFRVGSDKEETRARKKALTLVVAERNTLVHKMLHTFDGSSEESCRKLITLLDEQHDRVAPHAKYVMQILAAMKAVQQEMANHLKTDEAAP